MRKWNTADARERVRDNFGLQLDLARIRDMRVNASAAKRVRGFTTISGCFQDGRGGSKCQPPLHSFDPGGDALSGNCSGHEKDLSLVPRDHSAARRGLLDVDTYLTARAQHVSR